MSTPEFDPYEFERRLRFRLLVTFCAITGALFLLAYGVRYLIDGQTSAVALAYVFGNAVGFQSREWHVRKLRAAVLGIDPKKV